MKQIFSVAQHTDAGNKLKDIQNNLQELRDQLLQHYPKTGIADGLCAINRATKCLTILQSSLEDRMFAECGEKQTNQLPYCGVTVYFGRGRV